MTQIIIPAAGQGSRFVAAGFTDPKPFIHSNRRGKSLVEIAITDARSALGEPTACVVVLVRAENAQQARDLFDKDVTVVCVPELTSGAASTVQMAAPHLNPTEPVFVVNSDQTFSLTAFERDQFAAMRRIWNSVPLCFISNGDVKWSYFDPDTRQIIEKPPVAPPGRIATCGAYWFSTASAMLEAIADMKETNFKVNGEFYFAPCHNFLRGGTGPAPLILQAGEFFGLGTPEDFFFYELQSV